MLINEPTFITSLLFTDGPGPVQLAESETRVWDLADHTFRRGTSATRASLSGHCYVNTYYNLHRSYTMATHASMTMLVKLFFLCKRNDSRSTVFVDPHIWYKAC